MTRPARRAYALLLAWLAPLAACGTRVNAFDARDGAIDGEAQDGARDAGGARSDAGRDVVARDAAPRGPADMVLTDVETEIGCAADEWCWESPIPQGESVFSGFAFADDDQWLFGGAGLALHFDGVRWTRVATGTRANLDGAWGSAPDDLWVTGYRNDESRTTVERVLLRWNGSAFVPAPALPAGEFAREVHGSARDNVWVIAGRLDAVEGRVYRFDGRAWTAVATDTPLVPTGLWVESPTRVWVTSNASVEPARALRFDGTRFTTAGLLGPTGYSGFQRGPVVFEGAAFAIAGGAGSAQGLVRIDDSGVRGEIGPAISSSFDASLQVTGGSLWLLPASVSSTTRVIHRRRSLSTPWTSATVPSTATSRAPTVLVAGSAAGAWMSNGYADLYRLRDGAGAGTITLESTANRPRSTRFAGRASAPSGAVTIERSLLVRDAVAQRWTVSAPLASAARHAEFLSNGALAFTVSDEGVQRFANDTPVGPLYGRGLATVFARSADDAVASGTITPARWNGTSWTALPALPATAGALSLAALELDSLWADAQDVFAGGGVRQVELENDRLGVLCRLRANAWTCVTAPLLGGPSSINGLERGDDGALYALIGPSFGGGLLHRIDRDTLAFTEVTFNGARQSWSYLGGNERTGALVLANRDVTTIRPQQQRGETYSVPLSFWSSGNRDVHVGDDGTLWLLRENAEVLRLQPTLR